MLRILTIAIWLLLDVETASFAADLPSRDTKDWKLHRIDLGKQIVIFKVPQGESADWPRFDIPSRLTLDSPNLFDEAGEGPKLLARSWDYRANRFSIVYGTLHAYLVLWRSESELKSTDALRRAEEMSSDMIRATDIRRGGRGGPRDIKRYEVVTIGGKEGLLVRHSTTTPHYAVAVDANHYLTISISVQSNVSSPSWRVDAQGAVQEILRSIRIEPNPVMANSPAQK